jgi:tRNA modification GTPase
MLSLNRTIAAIATPLGDGGVAMIRVSGKDAFTIVSKVFSKPMDSLPSHFMTYGKVLNLKKEVVDDVMLVKFESPKSFTGEDTVEVFCHGGLMVTKKVLDTILEAGALNAQPGEFSFKAFMHGKIDLTQAEAIQKLIGAKNDYALKSAESQLSGALSKKIAQFQNLLIETAAIIDAWVDYPEEGLEFKSFEEVLLDLKTIYESLHLLKSTFEDGRKISYGLKLCLLGSPNAGKSSLMNALLGYDRAIVTAIAGTTRDLLQEDLTLSGLNFRLTDTAGIREASEIIEQEGIKRSKQAALDADLILFVVDGSSPITPEDSQLIHELPLNKTLLIYNKKDLGIKAVSYETLTTVFVSAITLDGLEELKKAINHKIWSNGQPPLDEILITEKRHYEAINEALINLEKVISGLESGVSPEFISFDLRMSLKALGTILGMDLTENILGSIFSKFCVGK